eukprot:1853465-Heterocapsa_arctica.AAC.1
MLEVVTGLNLPGMELADSLGSCPGALRVDSQSSSWDGFSGVRDSIPWVWELTGGWPNRCDSFRVSLGR